MRKARNYKTHLWMRRQYRW